MTAAIQTRRAAPRLHAIASIIRKDLHLFGWYAAAGALAMFVVSAFFHVQGDFPTGLLLHFGDRQLQVDAVLFSLSSVGVPVALLLFVVILAQADAATDMQRDWLVRPVAPLEILAAKVTLILAVVTAPMIAGNLVYMMIKPMPAAEVFSSLGLIGGCILVLVASWLVSTPFRALLALIGMFLLLNLAVISAILIKFAVAVALTGAPDTDVTPFPLADGSWILGFGGDIWLFAVSGLTLWLLLARRRLTAARWLFAGFIPLWFFVRFLLFVPN